MNESLINSTLSHWEVKKDTKPECSRGWALEASHDSTHSLRETVNVVQHLSFLKRLSPLGKTVSDPLKGGISEHPLTQKVWTRRWLPKDISTRWNVPVGLSHSFRIPEWINFLRKHYGKLWVPVSWVNYLSTLERWRYILLDAGIAPVGELWKTSPYFSHHTFSAGMKRRYSRENSLLIVCFRKCSERMDVTKSERTQVL